MGQYSPLFHQSHRRAREAAQAYFARTPIGEILDSSRQGKRIPPRDLQRIWGSLTLWGPTPDALKGMMGIRLGSIGYVIERYAKRNDDIGAIVREWLESLGPSGQFLLNLFSGLQSEQGYTRQAWLLRGAINFLQAFGYEVLPHPDRTKPGMPGYERARAAAFEWLRQTGELEASAAFGPPEVKPEDVFRGKSRAPAAPTSWGGILPPPRGFEHLGPDHPLFTGEFVPVESSNVHSAAYDYRDATLFVRFHAKKWDKEVQDYVPAGPGPIYAYSYVPPQMFLDLLQAGSPGSWVWDKLRIRGTVSGHRFDYRLVAIAGGYVPRKATFAPLKPGDYSGEYGEVFIPRAVQIPSGKWITSVKPYEVVRTFKPLQPISPKMQSLFGIG